MGLLWYADRLFKYQLDEGGEEMYKLHSNEEPTTPTDPTTPPDGEGGEGGESGGGEGGGTEE